MKQNNVRIVIKHRWIKKKVRSIVRTGRKLIEFLDRISHRLDKSPCRSEWPEWGERNHFCRDGWIGLDRGVREKGDQHRITLPEERLIEEQVIMSRDGGYRYGVRRRWGEGRIVMIILANPWPYERGKHEYQLDCATAWAMNHGFKAVQIVNLFPAVMNRDQFQFTASYEERTGGSDHLRCNDEFLLNEAKRADIVLCAWGGWREKEFQDREKEVIIALFDLGVDMYTIHPTHRMQNPTLLHSRCHNREQPHLWIEAGAAWYRSPVKSEEVRARKERSKQRAIKVKIKVKTDPAQPIDAGRINRTPRLNRNWKDRLSSPGKRFDPFDF